MFSCTLTRVIMVVLIDKLCIISINILMLTLIVHFISSLEIGPLYTIKHAQTSIGKGLYKQPRE